MSNILWLIAHAQYQLSKPRRWPVCFARFRRPNNRHESLQADEKAYVTQREPEWIPTWVEFHEF